MEKINHSSYRQKRTTAARRKRRKAVRRMKQIAFCVIAVVFICSGILLAGTGKIQSIWSGQQEADKMQAEQLLAKGQGQGKEEYPEDLLELLEKNPETYDFVNSYPQREKYQGKAIDLSEEVSDGEVPLFLQWDRRWGYDSYGNEMIALAGCGPACMSMAYTYLTGDMNMNPKEMADFAEEKGYNTKFGTSWTFFTEGASGLGLKGKEIGLDEQKMKQVLEQGKVIICSMGPGDFTTTGHFILIHGYDKKGFLVNDPNSKENSRKHWTFDTISSQIKCLWSIGA